MKSESSEDQYRTEVHLIGDELKVLLLLHTLFLTRVFLLLPLVFIPLFSRFPRMDLSRRCYIDGFHTVLC